jgi:hypothetical protein
MGVAKAPSAIYVYGSLGLIIYPVNKANVIADSLENQFTEHDLCDSDHRRHMEAKIEALLATVD